MRKILTIAICAYNMELFIREALESCVIRDLESIEVLIMNDGSTDQTANIAQEYCVKYPNSFHLITKENGGWGSNVNQAIDIGTGKYFRILDADDWFEIENLQKFVEVLKETDADLITSLYAHCLNDKHDIHRMEWEKFAGKELILNDLEEEVHLSMWGVTYRLDMLKEHPINLPSNVLYTDTLFVLKPLLYVKKVMFFDKVVYNYRLGRDGQSVGIDSLRKHYPEAQKVFEMQLDYLLECGEKCCNKKHIYHRVVTTYYGLLDVLFKLSDYDDIPVGKIIHNIEEQIKTKSPQLYRIIGERKYIKLLRLTKYKMVKTVYRLIKVKNQLKNRKVK